MDDSDPNRASTGGPQPGEIAGSSIVRDPGPGPASRPALPLVHRVFLGPGGIRAGWRLLIFLAITILGVIALSALVGFLARDLAGARSLQPGMMVGIGEGLVFLAALIAAAVMARIEKRALADYGLPWQGAVRALFWQGAAWGLLALSLLLILIKLGHGFDFGSRVLVGSQLPGWAAFWAVSFLLVGFTEEFVFRGYALFTLSTGMRFWPSALLLSATFGAIHLRNPGEDWAGGLAAGLIGLFFCFTLRRTGSLWFAIGLHAAWDYSESFIYGVPDSGAVSPGHLLNTSFHGPTWLTGGSVGPEGSALVFVIIAALFVLFALLHREVRFPRTVASSQSPVVRPETDHRLFNTEN